jgi:hypothetical protein
MTEPNDRQARDALDASASSAPASVHDALQQQITELLAAADLTDEERQQILVAMQCPCCGAGGLSLSIKLKPGRSTPSF